MSLNIKAASEADVLKYKIGTDNISYQSHSSVLVRALSQDRRGALEALQGSEFFEYEDFSRTASDVGLTR
jgi:hypothetical protein